MPPGEVEWVGAVGVGDLEVEPECVEVKHGLAAVGNQKPDNSLSTGNAVDV